MSGSLVSFPRWQLRCTAWPSPNTGATSDIFFPRPDWFLPSQGDWPDAAAHAMLMDGGRATAMVNGCSEERMDCECIRFAAKKNGRPRATA